jgi:cytoplasmic iron level regulating protein YaaA (DUF328/UPF0246 family)
MIILSPAKSMRFPSPKPLVPTSRPRFTSQRNALIEVMRGKTPSQLASLQHISAPLAQANADRWAALGTRSNDRGPAALCFTGDVYQGLDAATLTKPQQTWLQAHVRLLSGLYGLLRPMDMVQPYRLEMGTRLKTPTSTSLYQFWGERLTKQLRSDMESCSFVVNLASDEYAKAIDLESLHVPVLRATFLQEVDGHAKFMSFYAKRARGEMARWLAQQQPQSLDAIAAFNAEGYRLVDHTNLTMTFARPKPPPLSAQRRSA